MPRRRSCAGVALACALLGGCASARPSAQEQRFLAAANAICAQEHAALARTPQPATPAQAISYLPSAISVLRRQSARLSALEAPAAKRGELYAANSSAGQLESVLARLLAQLRAGTFELATLAQAQTRSVALREQIGAHFRRAGLARCGGNA